MTVTDAGFSLVFTSGKSFGNIKATELKVFWLLWAALQ